MSRITGHTSDESSGNSPPPNHISSYGVLCYTLVQESNTWTHSSHTRYGESAASSPAAGGCSGPVHANVNHSWSGMQILC